MLLMLVAGMTAQAQSTTQFPLPCGPDNQLLPTIGSSTRETFQPAPWTGGGAGGGNVQMTGERMVLWLSGLTGLPTRWTKAAQSTSDFFCGDPSYPLRKIESYTWDYRTYGADLLDAKARALQNNWVKPAYNNKIGYDPGYNAANTFIIAASNGGLVARQLDVLYGLGTAVPSNERLFNGIVTFGTSHQGAVVAKNRAQLLDFASYSCTELADGPAREQANQATKELFPVVVNGILQGMVAQKLMDIKNQLCEIIGTDAALSMAGEVFPPAQNAAASELEPNSPTLNTLNSSAGYTPNKVAFYGVETPDMMFFRTINSFVEGANSVQPFMANDNNAVVWANKSKLKYQAKRDAAHNAANAYNSYRKWHKMSCCPTWKTKALNAQKEADAWKRGVEWYTNANEIYRNIIGAVTYVPTNWTCECEQAINYGGVTEYQTVHPNASNAAACAANVGINGINNCEWIPLNYTRTEKDCDGIVLAESAGGWAGAKTAKMEGSNHEQMRNDENTKKRLFELFEGGYGPYFYTATK